MCRWDGSPAVPLPAAWGDTAVSPRTCWRLAGERVQPGRRDLGLFSPSVGVIRGAVRWGKPQAPWQVVGRSLKFAICVLAG